MQSAFVDIGLDGDAFLYVSDVFENLEDYDHGQPQEDAPAPALAAQGGPAIEVLPGKRWRQQVCTKRCTWTKRRKTAEAPRSGKAAKSIAPTSGITP